MGYLALTSQFPRVGEEAIRAPLRLTRCVSCKLLQLADTVRPESMYTESYGYKSGTNEQMVAHLTDLVDFVAARYDVKPGDAVLDIASNDGTLLKAWAPYEVNRYGVDPIAAGVPDCQISPSYFMSEVRYYGMKAITSVAVLYDLDDPVTFVHGIADALAPDGVWVAEVQYAGEIFDGKWDQICHEHLCYYGLSHLMHLASSAGLFFDYAEVNPSNGGSLRACFTKTPPKHAPRGYGLVQDEYRWNVSELPGMIRRSAGRIWDAVYEEGAVYVLGASTKGNTILQVAELDSATIIAALDRNDAKVGRTLPGSGVPIIRDDENMPPGASFLVLPYHFRRSMLARHKHLGRFIFPLPNVSVVCA